VLREWVEDQHHRRRRIARDRIVTPLEPRPLSVDPKAIEDAMRGDRLFQEFGVAIADVLVDDIARLLLGKEVPGYYKRQIARVVSGTLRRRLRHAGRGIYLDRRWDSKVLRIIPAFRRALVDYRTMGYVDIERLRRDIKKIGT
jgi:hypothetical protein